MLSSVRLSSVCLSSVCSARAPYSGGSNFRQYFYSILAALLHGTLVWASAKLCGDEQRAPPIFGRAAITLGSGPHFYFDLLYILYNKSTLNRTGAVRATGRSESPVDPRCIITARRATTTFTYDGRARSRAPSRVPHRIRIIGRLVLITVIVAGDRSLRRQPITDR